MTQIWGPVRKPLETSAALTVPSLDGSIGSVFTFVPIVTIRVRSCPRLVTSLGQRKTIKYAVWHFFRLSGKVSLVLESKCMPKVETIPGSCPYLQSMASDVQTATEPSKMHRRKNTLILDPIDICVVELIKIYGRVVLMMSLGFDDTVEGPWLFLDTLKKKERKKHHFNIVAISILDRKGRLRRDSFIRKGHALPTEVQTSNVYSIALMRCQFVCLLL